VVETRDAPLPPGLALVERSPIMQLIAEALAPGDAPAFTVTPLTNADGPEMLALATLTRPGPFFARTHQLGDFVGVRADGRLAAMAGERMRLPGHTEVSGVCTHPDHQGRGYAAALTRMVAANILARGETPFMHVFEANADAISIYQALGFRLRREMRLAVFGRA
jgi:hypothetical protein